VLADNPRSAIGRGAQVPRFRRHTFGHRHGPPDNFLARFDVVRHFAVTKTSSKAELLLNGREARILAAGTFSGRINTGLSAIRFVRLFGKRKRTEVPPEKGTVSYYRLKGAERAYESAGAKRLLDVG
jgi:hypothetical protein